MVAVKISSFGGMIPAQDDRLLPDTAASYSENSWVYSGTLRGVNTPEFIRNCVLSQTAKVYRIPKNLLDAEHLADSDWMEFTDPDTDIVRAPVINDQFERYYWASPSDVPRYNTLVRIKAGNPAWMLGIPQPGTAPGVSPSGGSSSVIVSRSYVYTWVSEYGEEGPPSSPTTVTGKQDDTWSITLTAADGDDIGGPNRNLTDVRIYRTVTGSNGQATYFLVTEQVIADTTYSDTLSDATVTSNTQLQSTNWSGPPATLEGMTVMPNGIIAGFYNNELWFCEPYRPHAWPAAYTLATEYPIVGLGVINQSLVICTAGFPMTATGLTPAAMTLSKMATFEPCMSRGSIVSAIEGVYYASQNGVVLVAQGVAINFTRDLVTKDKWLSLLKVATLRAARIGQAYYAFGSAKFGVFEGTAFDVGTDPYRFAAEDFSGSYTGVLLDPKDLRVAFNVMRHPDIPTINVMNDPWTGEVLVIRDNKVYWINMADLSPVPEEYIWTSKEFQTTEKKNIGAMRMYFRVPAGVDLADYGVIRVYADDVLRLTRPIVASGEIIKLPSGFKSDFWQFEFQGRVEITSFQAAGSAKGLENV